MTISNLIIATSGIAAALTQQNPAAIALAVGVAIRQHDSGASTGGAICAGVAAARRAANDKI